MAYDNNRGDRGGSRDNRDSNSRGQGRNDRDRGRRGDGDRGRRYDDRGQGERRSYGRRDDNRDGDRRRNYDDRGQGGRKDGDRRRHYDDRGQGERKSYGRRDDDRGRGQRRDDRDSGRRFDDRGQGERKSYGRRDDDRGRGQRRDDRDRGRRFDDRDRGKRREEEPKFAGQRSTGRPQRRQDDRFPTRRRQPHQAEYRSADPDEPVIPAGVVADELGPEALRALDTLAGANKEIVARHLVTAGQLLEVDPDKAYEHAQAAVKRAGRVDVVREAAALTAYATGRYEEALREVRAVRRMRGDESLRAIEADSERGLGRPEKALEVIEAADTKGMPLEEQVEVLLVAAGARQDLEQTELALLMIEDALNGYPEQGADEPRSRLMSMQADLLRALDREDEAAAVEAAMPVEEEIMEITDLGELLDADVDHTRTSIRGTDKPLTEIYDSLIMDLDGVCFEGTNPIDHAAVVLNEVADGGTKLAYATNNASRSSAQVVEKLAGFDIPAEADHVITSAMDAMFTLKEELEPGDTVLVIGTENLENLVNEAGFTAVRTAESDVDAVIQGYAPDVGWAQLSEAAYAINNGARFYATNLDTTLPTERGMALGNGSLVAAVSRATNRRAQASGKPHPEIMVRAAELVDAERPLGVGDRLETDTAAAVAARIPTIHVLTGVSQAKDVIGAKKGERPTYLAMDLRGLQDIHPQPKHHRDGTWTAGVSQPVSFTRWGHLVIDGIELRPDGDPVTLNLDTYRAAAAAGWEALDSDRRLRLPEIIVVDNDDMSGVVNEPNYEEIVEEEVLEGEATADSATGDDATEDAAEVETSETPTVESESEDIEADEESAGAEATVEAADNIDEGDEGDE